MALFYSGAAHKITFQKNYFLAAGGGKIFNKCEFKSAGNHKYLSLLKKDQIHIFKYLYKLPQCWEDILFTHKNVIMIQALVLSCAVGNLFRKKTKDNLSKKFKLLYIISTK